MLKMDSTMSLLHY